MTHATTTLSVNLNKVALLRNSREHGVPSVARFARICIAAGAGGITVHPRPDLRHIRPDDVRVLAALVAEHPGVELNVEGNPFEGPSGPYPGYMALVREVRPAQCTLVPDAPGQLTSDHGFGAGDVARLRDLVAEMKGWGSRVSLFVDPDPAPVAALAASGADRIEIYTGPYAMAHWTGDHAAALQACVATARAATDAGLGVNAGHDLDLTNLSDLVRAIPALAEVSIGHALTADALERGFEATVKAYLGALRVG